MLAYKSKSEIKLNVLRFYTFSIVCVCYCKNIDNLNTGLKVIVGSSVGLGEGSRVGAYVGSIEGSKVGLVKFHVIYFDTWYKFNMSNIWKYIYIYIYPFEGSNVGSDVEAALGIVDGCLLGWT